MTLFFVTYDLRAPGRDYNRFADALSMMGAKPILDSVYSVRQNLTLRQVYDRLAPHIDANDGLLVIESGGSQALGLRCKTNLGSI